MRRLLILRHAKSDRPEGVQDILRPLAPRGIAAAEAMGRYLDDQQLWPDAALVSSSQRTLETWGLVQPLLSHAPQPQIERGLYHASPSVMLSFIHAVPDAVGTLMLVGHNPGCEELAALLTGFGDRYAAARMAQKFPTAALAVIDFAEGGWGDVAPRQGRLDRFVTPAALGAGPDEA